MKLRINSCDGIYDSFDVRFTKFCDNKCRYCIERLGIKALPMATIPYLIMQTISMGIKNVLILGGEPFLFPYKLNSYIWAIREFAESIYVTTSLPVTFIYDQDICHHTIDLIDGINISINSANPATNDRIFQSKSHHDRIQILRNLLDQIRFKYKIRVNLNLVKGGIDNFNDLMSSLKILEDMGCTHVKINELQNSPRYYVSFEDLMSTNMPSPYSHGCQTKIKISDINMKITLKRSCFLTEPSRQASWMDFAKTACKIFMKPKNEFRVMYEDGSISKGWKSCQGKST